MKKNYQFPLTASVELLGGNICEGASPAGSNPLINETTMPGGAPVRIPDHLEVAK